MKHSVLVSVLLPAMVLAICHAAAATVQQTQDGEPPSLADAVRKLQQNKGASTNAPHSYTNDNLPRHTVVNVAGSSTPEPAPEKVSAKEGKKESPGAAPADAKPADPTKLVEEWTTKIGDQKKQIAALEHELDLLQREYQLRVAELYWDAGNRLRDDKKWAEDEQKQKDDVAEKTAKLDSLRQKLEELLEGARKAGVPSRLLE